MQEKILQFARGNFENAQAKLQLSETNLIIQVEEGREQKGSFYIGNAGGVPMEGILYSDCPYMHLKQMNFTGDEVSIEYTFTAARMLTGEVEKGSICIVTNCGEITLPFIATVGLPTISYSGGRISDLNGFAGVARDIPEEAVGIFTSGEFPAVFLHRDVDNQTIYSGLIKGSEPRIAMEEFLIAIRKKNRIILSVDKNNLFYSNCRARTYDKVTLTRSTWGCMDIAIYSDFSCIVPVHDLIKTEQAASDCIDVTFEIIPDRMHYGKNTGCIYIETVHQRLEIHIECIRPYDAGTEPVHGNNGTIVRMMKEYLEFRSDKTAAGEYVLRMDPLLSEYREQSTELMFAAWQAHIAMVGGQLETDDPYISLLRLAGKPSEGAATEEVFEYSAACYVAALTASDELKDKLTGRALGDIRFFYGNGYECWEMFWFLLNIDTRYRNGRIAFDGILRYIEEGCSSPVMYLEMCLILKKNPDYMHDWHDCMIRPMAWGIREGLFDREMAMAFTYHISRTKQFSEIVYLSLARLYEQFELEDTLKAICVMLIKADKTSPAYFKWYELGVGKQLRITQIYEYYMHALGDADDKILPHQVLMYFMYDNHLGQKEKAVLYSAAVRGKEVNPSAYRAYTLMIYNYTRCQLEEGNISVNLATLYEDSLKLDEIDETVAKSLPDVMFRYEISCTNPNMKGVYVVHNELADETYVPFVNGSAMVSIYSEKVYLFLVDRKGNRYLESQDYTLNKLLRLDAYADRCFELAPDNYRLLSYMFGRCEKDYHMNQNVIRIRRYVNERLKLRDYYRKKNLSALIQYYYEHAEGDYLDRMLESIALKDSERENCGRLIELMMIRGMNRRALEACMEYGHRGIDSTRLAKFCDSYIQENGLDTENEEILRMAYAVYEAGEYSDNILGYLARYYRGASENMLELWKVLGGFGISRSAYEERLLSQLLFTEYVMQDVFPVVESFIEEGSNKILKKAVISYLAYRYLVNDEELTDKIWGWMRETLKMEDNVVCTLAVLKWFSRREMLDEDETVFCDLRMSVLIQKGIIMPFYKEFAGKIQLPGDIEDRVLVSCTARPGARMMIKYVVDSNKPVIARAKEMFHGIYVKALVVFEGEGISYEFYEEKEFSRNIMKTGTVNYSTGNGGEMTRFGMLNRMIKYASDEDVEGLYTAMSSYIRLEETSKQLFTIL